MCYHLLVERLFRFPAPGIVRSRGNGRRGRVAGLPAGRPAADQTDHGLHRPNHVRGRLQQFHVGVRDLPETEHVDPDGLGL